MKKNKIQFGKIGGFSLMAPGSVPGTVNSTSETANSAPSTTNSTSDTPNSTAGTANSAPGTANSAPGTANSASGTANSAPGTANSAPGITADEEQTSTIQTGSFGTFSKQPQPTTDIQTEDTSNQTQDVEEPDEESQGESWVFTC